MNNKKTFLAILFLVVLTVVASALGSLVTFSTKNEAVAQAMPDRDVTGWAWSSNIGWISFNGANYGVTLEADGDLVGYAWANPRDPIGPDGDPKFNNIGWIKFNPEGPYPGTPNESAHLDETTGAVTGWARACAAAPTPGSCNGGVGTNANANDWDGWIKLSGNKIDGNPWTESVRAVKVNDAVRSLTGYAWGSEVVGWIDFSPGYSGAVPPGEVCDPTKEVCVDDPNTDNLAVNCYSNANNGQVVLSGSSVSVNWTAQLLKYGTPDYTYTWEGAGLSPNPTVGSPTEERTDMVTATYDSLGVKEVTITVADESPNQQPASKTCYVNVVDGGTPPSGGTDGLLSADDEVIYISEQASGHSAETIVSVAKPGAQITNVGVVGSVVSNLRVTEVTSTKGTKPTLQSILDQVSPGSSLQYSLDVIPNSGNFQISPDTSLSLDEGESVYFRLKVPVYNEAIAANSPYKVVITGDTVDSKGNFDPTDDESIVVTVPILFNYLVGTYIQQ